MLAQINLIIQIQLTSVLKQNDHIILTKPILTYFIFNSIWHGKTCQYRARSANAYLLIYSLLPGFRSLHQMERYAGTMSS